jgi:hypothetical protein
MIGAGVAMIGAGVVAVPNRSRFAVWLRALVSAPQNASVRTPRPNGANPTDHDSPGDR